jgi:hypothetical protein
MRVEVPTLHTPDPPATSASQMTGFTSFGTDVMASTGGAAPSSHAHARASPEDEALAAMQGSTMQPVSGFGQDSSMQGVQGGYLTSGGGVASGGAGAGATTMSTMELESRFTAEQASRALRTTGGSLRTTGGGGGGEAAGVRESEFQVVDGVSSMLDDACAPLRPAGVLLR